jgi:NADPH:quinone reductase-like Zn-dependent oxidoreductase
MRAIVVHEQQTTPEIVELDLPEPGEGEVRVRVVAASVNGFDLAVANGYLAGMMEHRYPVVLGKDFAGVIDAIGGGVEGYTVGDRVFGVVSKPFLGDGSFGEYVAVPAAVGLARLPDGLDFPAGAALGLAGTAAAAAVAGAEVQPGQAVLVAGATGGVGNLAVQLLTAAGANVIATAHTEEEIDDVTRLGAQSTVDYRADLPAAVKAVHPEGVDVALHLAGDAADVLSAVRPGGRLVSTLLGSPEQLPSDSVTVVPVYANPTPETLTRLAGELAAGTTKLPIQRTYDLTDISQAFADFAAGTRGKLVITVG